MLLSIGGMAVGHHGPSRCHIGRDILGIFIGQFFSGGRLTGDAFSLCCGQFGLTETRSFSGVPPLPATPSSMPQGAFLIPGSEVA